MAYKSSTCAKEKKKLRKYFAVVRAMVAAEEGSVSDSDTSDGSFVEEEYDYYVEDDPLHFDQVCRRVSMGAVYCDVCVSFWMKMGIWWRVSVLK